MNKQDARLLMMDYLYDEMSNEKKAEFEKLMEEHPGLKKELDEMSETRGLLQQIQAETPGAKLFMMNPEKGRFAARFDEIRKVVTPRSTFGKTALSLAALFLVTVLLASAAKLTVSTAGDGITLAFGGAPVVHNQNNGLSKEEADALIQQIRQENAVLATNLIRQAQEQQNEQFEDAMMQIVQYFETQRANDLQLLGGGIAQLEEVTYSRFQQTDQTLNGLLYAISTQQE